MSDMKPEISPQTEPELESVQPPARTHRPLPLVICWALAPAMLMALAGVCMELGTGEALPSILLFLGGLGGIPALFVWSIWMVEPANWSSAAKVLMVFPITLAMCAVNLFLAFGACAMIDPPFHIQ